MDHPGELLARDDAVTGLATWFCREDSRLLLACGILGAAASIGADLLAASQSAGYDLRHQVVREFLAAGAPTDRLATRLFSLSGVLMVAFSLGVWLVSDLHPGIRTLAGAIAANALAGIALWNFLPEPVRGELSAWQAAARAVLAFNPFTLLMLALGAGLPGRLRPYSVLTLSVVLASAGATLLYLPRLAAGEPTLFLGAIERMSHYGQQLWYAVLAGALIRDRIVARGAGAS